MRDLGEYVSPRIKSFIKGRKSYNTCIIFEDPVLSTYILRLRYINTVTLGAARTGSHGLLLGCTAIGSASGEYSPPVRMFSCND